MTYDVKVDSIAQDVDEQVQYAILRFLETYQFPYVTSIQNTAALRDVFRMYFEERHDYAWLKNQVYDLARREGRNLRGVAAVAFSEPNRIHTAALGGILLKRGQTQCTTVHSYGRTPMSPECQANLEGKVLSIQDVVSNSFPDQPDDLTRTDLPMIPQHVNCRHVMAPLE